MQLDNIIEDDSEDLSPEDAATSHVDNVSAATDISRKTHSHDRVGCKSKNTESDSMVRSSLSLCRLDYIPSTTIRFQVQLSSSSPDSPEDFQVWLHLRTFSNKTFALPQCAQRRLWLTRLLGWGLTGSVWTQCHDDVTPGPVKEKCVELAIVNAAFLRPRQARCAIGGGNSQ